MRSDLLLADYAAVQEYLYGMKAQGVKFGIDRMALFSERIGNPEREVPTIHIAGTNGKGSVSAMLESIFRTTGLKTGLYTSPHLVRLGERVQVNRHLLTEEEICAYCRELRPLADALLEEGGPDDHPSFFEFMTAMAFLQFARQRCDISLIEVGLGGRLDATNVVLPEVSVITSIGLDHCEMLGDTVEKIAAEKAGIIKAGRPVVIGRMPAGAEATIRGIASQMQVPLISVREVYGESLEHYPKTNLEGDYQRWNAATATLAARALSPDLRPDDSVIAEGLLKVDWPGRWERTRIGKRHAILDASHNPEGAEVLDVNMAALERELGKKPVVITGALGAVRALPLLETVCRHAKDLYLVVPHQARACSHAELEALVPASFKGRVIRSSVEELFPDPDTCTAGDPDDEIVVTGSIYLLGEVLARIQPNRGLNEGRLQDF